MKKKKVRLFKVFGHWRASLSDVHFACGVSPVDAYLNLQIYLLAQGKTRLVLEYMPNI